VNKDLEGGGLSLFQDSFSVID